MALALRKQVQTTEDMHEVSRGAAKVDTLRRLSILESSMSWVWFALVRALKVRKTGTISAGRPAVSCCVMFKVLPVAAITKCHERLQDAQLARHASTCGKYCAALIH